MGTPAKHVAFECKNASLHPTIHILLPLHAPISASFRRGRFVYSFLFASLSGNDYLFCVISTKNTTVIVRNGQKIVDLDVNGGVVRAVRRLAHRQQQQQQKDTKTEIATHLKHGIRCLPDCLSVKQKPTVASPPRVHGTSVQKQRQVPAYREANT